MCKNRIRLIRGDAFSIAFHNVCLPIIVDGEGIECNGITEEDRLEFSIRRKDHSAVLAKTYPGEMERNGNTFYVTLTAEETEKLPCILYRIQLEVDIANRGEEVYTLVDNGAVSYDYQKVFGY